MLAKLVVGSLALLSNGEDQLPELQLPELSLIQKNAEFITASSSPIRLSPLQNMANDPVYARALREELTLNLASGATDDIVPISKKHKGKKHNDLHDVRPRVLIMDGCSSSTFVQQLAIRLMREHGITVKDAGEGGNHVDKLVKHVQWELSASEKGQLMGQHHPNNADAVNLSIMAEERAGNSLTFKIRPILESWLPSFEVMNKVLSDANAQTVLVYRGNVLDWTVCQVRDCFGAKKTRAGHPVTPDGKENKACFDRRSSAELTTLAKFDKDKILDFLQTSVANQTEQRQALIDAGALKHSDRTLKAEALLEFEYKKGNMENSVKEWAAFMQSWSVKPNLKKIRHVLSTEPTAASLPSQGPHSQIIYNFKEVKDILKKNGFGKYMRE